MRCDCEDEGREAYRYERYSYETQRRLDEARYGYGSECSREFLDGFRSEERRDEERREEEDAEERRCQQRAYEQAMAEQQAYEQSCYEADMQAQYERDMAAQEQQP